MKRLRMLRIKAGLNMKQVASILNIPYTTYVSYEKGDRETPTEILIRLAEFYNTTVDYILNSNDSNRQADSLFASDIIPVPKTKSVPLVGTIACGKPLFAEENIESMVCVPEHIHADFALRCKGDSMTGARIFDNDIVYIRKQDAVENGEIAAVLIDNETTLKRFFRYGDTVVLRAENPAFREIQYKNEELNNIKILGKAVCFFSTVY